MNNFNSTEYTKKVVDFYDLMIENIEIFTVKISSDKWSLYEMVCHLLDSASNNHQRFVRLQQTKVLSFPGYIAEEWVSISNIQNIPSKDLITFWRQYNEYILELIRNIKTDSLENVWEIDGKKYSLQYLVEDYFRHLQWHVDLFRTRVKEIKKSAVK